MPPSPSDARQTDPQTIRFPFDANFNGLLEHYFDEFLSKHDHYSDDKIVDIIGKTLRKMSPKGHSAALALSLPKRTRKLVEAALAREGPVLQKLASVAID